MFCFLGSKTVVIVIVQMVKSLLKLLAYMAEGKKPFTSEIIFESFAFGKYIDIYAFFLGCCFFYLRCIYLYVRIYIYTMHLFSK